MMKGDTPLIINFPLSVTAVLKNLLCLQTTSCKGFRTCNLNLRSHFNVEYSNKT